MNETDNGEAMPNNGGYQIFWIETLAAAKWV
jgi:hypothetical protein